MKRGRTTKQEQRRRADLRGSSPALNRKRNPIVRPRPSPSPPPPKKIPAGGKRKRRYMVRMEDHQGIVLVTSLFKQIQDTAHLPCTIRRGSRSVPGAVRVGKGEAREQGGGENGGRGTGLLLPASPSRQHSCSSRGAAAVTRPGAARRTGYPARRPTPSHRDRLSAVVVTAMLTWRQGL
jgi:hypothetical protein